MAFMNISGGASVGVYGHLSMIVQKALTIIARRRTYNRTLNELRRLSVRELDDVGIHQSMITQIALQAVYGK